MFLFLSLTLSGGAQAETLKVHYAGFAFRGDFTNIQANYPMTFSISQEKLPDGRGLLDAALADKLAGLTLKNASLVQGALANLGDGSITLACGFDSELVAIEKYEDGFKVVVDLGAQILLFDYSQMRLIASYPIMVELIDFVKDQPTDEMLRNIVRDLLLSDKYDINLLDDFKSLLSDLELKSSYGSAIKITHVDVHDQAVKDLPDQMSRNIGNFKTFVAQGFGKFLSKNQKVAIIPYTKGADIGNKMALTFSEAKVLSLEIPEPQFAVELTIQKFKKVCTDKKSSGSCWIYGTFANVKVLQPALGKIYIDEKVKKGVSKIIPSSQITVEDWPSYQNSLLALFNEVTQQFSTEKKYKNIRKVIEKCI